MFWLVLACTGSDGDSASAAQDRGEAQELVLPSLEGIDLEAAYLEAVQLALTTTTSAAWTGHVSALDTRQTGCPDAYLGIPDALEFEDEELEDAPGLFWQDYCRLAGGLYYRGYVAWNGEVELDGDKNTSSGQVLSGERQMYGDGVIGVGDELYFELDGEVSDAVYSVEANGYSRWTYSSLLDATVRGTRAFDDKSATPGGWRSDLYLYASGGDVDYIELRGDTYYQEHRIQERFDSSQLHLTVQGELGAGPEDCLLEPIGWMGLRDENAYWYDLVFLPGAGEELGEHDYENPDYVACDGCGTLYVRGLQQEEIGQVCIDFSELFSGDTVELPRAEDFVLTLRDVTTEGP